MLQKILTLLFVKDQEGYDDESNVEWCGIGRERSL